MQHHITYNGLLIPLFEAQVSVTKPPKVAPLCEIDGAVSAECRPLPSEVLHATLLISTLRNQGAPSGRFLDANHLRNFYPP